MSENRYLGLLLLLFILLGSIYALVTPPFEASDELWHYPMIRHLADGNPLPVQVFDPALAGTWKQEASQPPLYYYIGAALTFWINTADMEQVRKLNPHVDNGVITQDGNTNLVVHDPHLSRWRGTLLAITLIRLFSVILGAITIHLTYQIAREILPNRAEIALGAAGLTAFMPMFLFISGAVNNDNLAIPLASFGILLMIRRVRRPMPNQRWQIIVYWLLLGVVLGLGILTKQGTIGLLPLAWGTAFIFSWQKSNRFDRFYKGSVPGSSKKAVTPFWQVLVSTFGQSLFYFGLTMLPMLLIAGWWYYRNMVLYGDLLGWSAFTAVLGERAHPASLAQLWGERQGFLLSYWGLFGGVNIPMAMWVYRTLNAVLLVGIVGFCIFAFRQMRDWKLEVDDRDLIFNFQSLISNFLNFIIARFALVLSFLFATAVVLGLIRWATTTWSSQGRLVFTAISALNSLLMVGFVGWMPPNWAKRVVAALVTFMFLIAAYAPFGWIQPAYNPSAYEPPRPPIYLQPKKIDFGKKLRLRGVEVQPAVLGTTTTHPGEDVWVHLEWEVLERMERDWSVFVHLNDPILGQPIAQRDMYLQQGLTSTRWLEPGQRILNSYLLQVPETAIVSFSSDAPTTLDVVVGLYDFYTNERLPVTAEQDAAVVAKMTMQALPGEVPNPINVNFGNEIELVGFEVTPRRASPGGTINLTLYWKALRPLTTNYTAFTQIVALDTTRWASQDLGFTPPTSTWTVDEIQPVNYSLTLDEATPAGLYPLIVGLYTQNSEGEFIRLQVVTNDGRFTDDFLELTPVRVD